MAKEFKKGYRIIRKNKALQGMDQESMKGGGVENINLLGYKSQGPSVVCVSLYPHLRDSELRGLLVKEHISKVSTLRDPFCSLRFNQLLGGVIRGS